MSAVVEILTDLAQQGHQLSTVEGKLIVRSPNGKLTPDLRQRLVTHKAEILDLLGRRDAEHSEAELPRILPAPDKRYLPFPLTEIQQAYLIGRSADFELGNNSMHAYSEFDCQGFDLERLNRAWRRVVERHDMLRAVITAEGQQRILENVPDYRIEVEDLRGRAPAEVATRLAQVREVLSQKVLEVDRWPAFDFQAFLQDDDHLRLVFNIDLIHLDGGSLWLVFKDVARFYEDPNADLPPFELSYRDYVLAQQKLEESREYGRSLEYWRQRVETLPPAPELPLAKDPAESTQHRFMNRTARIAASTWRRVKHLAGTMDLTPSAAVLTAYSDVLATWSRSEQASINVTVFNRLPLHPQVPQVLGNFTSMVPVGLESGAGTTFDQRARYAQQQLWDSLEHRRVSGVTILRELARVRREPWRALMPVVFTSFLTLDSRIFAPPAIETKELGVLVYQVTRTPQVSLDLQVFEEDGDLICSWNTVDELFPASMLDEMFASLCSLLQQLAEKGTWAVVRAPRVPEEAQCEQEADMTFWRRRLEGAPSVLELPTDRPRPARQSYRESSHRIALSGSLTSQLQQLGRRYGATLSTTLHAAFQTLLARYSNQSDICVGTPVAVGADRSRVNMLVIRVDHSGDPGFPQLLSRVRDAESEARSHGQLPYEDLLRELAPEPSPAHSPLFQAEFGSRKALAGRGADATPRPDLSLSLAEESEGMAGSLLFNGELFDAPTAARLTRHFITLLENLATEPEHRLSAASLLAAPERFQTLKEWNDTARQGWEGGFLELFQRQVERSPEAVAAVFATKQFTYRELDRRSNRLAHHLVERGVGPEVLVALFAERGLAFLTAIMAVFKAGGAYLPLDPLHPTRRHAQVLGQSRPAIVLAASESMSAVEKALSQVQHTGGSEPSLTALRLEELLEREHPDEASTPHCGARRLAYVIFTSGSTGLPKGAMVEQRGMLNHLRAKISDLDLTAADRVAQTASQCFDISVWQFLAALLVGGRVHVYAPEVAHDSRRLLDEAAAQRITVLETVPALLQAMLEELDRSESPELDLARLRWMIPTGEALPPELCRRWLAHHPAVPLLNAYGPTECSDDVTHHTIRVPPAAGAPRIPIGRPLVNTRIYVLDPRLGPVPTGCSGELYVAGTGVGRGYLRDSSRTAQTFLPDPFARSPGERLYRTGDLAHYQADGCLEFLGRADHQVKIRGFRIELGEVESVLRQHPAVRQVVVVARQDVSGSQRLVAYLVSHQEAAASVDELNSFLARQLPEYMVPSAFVLLEELPLTPNGKVDRRALPEPDARRPESEEKAVAPRNPMELRLAEIWSDVLGVHPIGVTDEFFELGGHSLLAMRLMARIESRFGVRLPLPALFRNPTVAGLATLLRQRVPPPSRSLVEIQPSGSRRALFFVHPIGGNIFCYVDLARHLGQDRPVYGFAARGLDGDEPPWKRIEEMAQSYVSELRAVQPEGPYLLGGLSMGGIVAFEMARSLENQGEQVALTALLDCWAPATNAEPQADEQALLGHFAWDLGLSCKQLPAAPAPGASHDQILAQFLSHARRAKVMPPEIDLAQMRQLFRVFKANHLALASYVPRPYAGRVTLFRASVPLAETFRALETEARSFLNGSKLAAFGRSLPDLDATDPEMGWGKLAAGGVSVHEVPGDHYSVLREPHVRIVSERLRLCLEETEKA